MKRLLQSEGRVLAHSATFSAVRESIPAGGLGAGHEAKAESRIVMWTNEKGTTQKSLGVATMRVCCKGDGCDELKEGNIRASVMSLV